jgi:hypothetical protein
MQKQASFESRAAALSEIERLRGELGDSDWAFDIETTINGQYRIRILPMEMVIDNWSSGAHQRPVRRPVRVA